MSEERVNLDKGVSVQASGKMITTPRRSPRKRTRIPLSHMLQVLQESDEESDDEPLVLTNTNKSLPKSGARPMRRSPRKTAQQKANRTEQMIHRSDQEIDAPDTEIHTPARNANQVCG
ncbi:uncharacterized protein LOC134279780 [Saccostrea cucullata]|uniref:uncharacterized protein LOC134279780 n=1 Tax=Saccostrea cuccullata TaxID=36930 RepID=UPI002ED2632B